MGCGDSHPCTLHSPTDAALPPRKLFFHFPGKERPVCFLPKKICVLILAFILPFYLNAPVYIAAAEAQWVPQAKTTCLEATGNVHPPGSDLPVSVTSRALSHTLATLRVIFTRNGDNVSVFINPREEDTSAHIYTSSVLAEKLHMLF